MFVSQIIVLIMRMMLIVTLMITVMEIKLGVIIVSILPV